MLRGGLILGGLYSRSDICYIFLKKVISYLLLFLLQVLRGQVCTLNQLITSCKPLGFLFL